MSVLASRTQDWLSNLYKLFFEGQLVFNVLSYFKNVTPIPNNNLSPLNVIIYIIYI